MYDSPSGATLSLGWDDPFLVDGVATPLDGFPRYDNPWVQTPFRSRDHDVFDADSGLGLILEYDTPRRELYRAGTP